MIQRETNLPVLRRIWPRFRQRELRIWTARCLVVALGLSMMGCGSLRHHSSKHSDAADWAAIQKVLGERNDIRQVISHVPTTEEEIDGPAQLDPNALIFNVEDYAKRLRTIPLKGCPEDFKEAFVKYAEAWNNRAAANPKLEILLSGGKLPPPDKIPDEAQATELAWRQLQEVVSRYKISKPEED